ncbi:hypothetical protein [Spirosoma litoris]
MLFGRIHIVRTLLATAALALLSVYGYYCAREWVAKWVFAHKSYFSADELILITVARKDITSTTAYLLNEGEFEWHGDMVDVLHREVRTDTVYIYGFRDEAETKLKQEAAWLYPDKTRADQPLNSQVRRAKWLSPFILPRSSIIAPMACLTMPESQPVFAYSSPRIRIPLLKVIAPPPNFR